MQQAVLQDSPDLLDRALYVCGPLAMVEGAKASLLAHRASLERAYSGSFVFQAL